MVAKGSTLTIVVGGAAGLVTVAGLKAQVSAGLASVFNVRSFALDVPPLIDSILNLQYQWEYVGTLVCETRVDYGAADDAASIVAHHFYVATEIYPSSVSITDVAAPGKKPIATGQASPKSPGEGGILDTIGELLAGVGDTVKYVLIGLAVVVVLVLLLVAFGPNIPKIAKVVV